MVPGMMAEVVWVVGLAATQRSAATERANADVVNGRYVG